jgi:uncharacterized protein
MENELRPFWNRIFNFNWKFGLFLILIVCIPRFILVLNANATGNYSYIGLIMAISAIVPFIFLNKYGLKQIGITKPAKYSRLLIAFASGLIASLILYLLGQLLYGHTFENWYTYIGKSYNIPPGMDQRNKAIMFSIMALTGMTFSPIGEELFFRGIVHAAFAKSSGDRIAGVADGSAFALTHVAHFGLVFINSQWNFLPIPAFLWVIIMFFVSAMFFTFKKYSGSILGAMICHSAFNLGMIFSIFYLL